MAAIRADMQPVRDATRRRQISYESKADGDLVEDLNYGMCADMKAAG